MSFYETAPADSERYLFAAKLLRSARDLNKEQLSTLMDVVNSFRGGPEAFPQEYFAELDEFEYLMRKCIAMMENLGGKFEELANDREYHAF